MGYDDTTAGWHAFIWTELDGIVDLNTLLDASGANWVLIQARGINDRSSDALRIHDCTNERGLQGIG